MLADKCEWATLIRKDPSLFFSNTESYQRGGGVTHRESDLNQEIAFKIGSTTTTATNTRMTWAKAALMKQHTHIPVRVRGSDS